MKVKIERQQSKLNRKPSATIHNNGTLISRFTLVMTRASPNSIEDLIQATVHIFLLAFLFYFTYF